jgi:hypothetical protein
MDLRGLFTLWKTQVMETGRKIGNFEYEDLSRVESLPLRRTRHGRKDNIKKISLRETGCSDVDWIHVTPDRDICRVFVNVDVNFWVL